MKQHATVKIPIHSLIDLITNSSTEIFVTSESSVKPAKKLLEELLKINGSAKTVDEVFTLSVQMDIDRLADILSDQIEEYDEDMYEKLGLEGKNWSETDTIITKYIDDINEGKEERPKYFDEMLEDTESSVGTYLIVKSNDSTYNHFLELLTTFLYSPDYDESYN